MAGRSRIWQVAAAVFVFINVAGIAYGAAMSDGVHAGAHVAILIAGYLVWRMPWGRRQDLSREPKLDEQRIEYLQQSVDAIALEVERIGEKQRFSDKLRVERGENPSLKKD